MPFFQKKPVVVEAFRWMVDEVPQWWKDKPDIGVDVLSGTAMIPTLEGVMKAQSGDWIIRGVKGEIYPCKPDIFDLTYAPVS